jgi:ABC-type branched-subunit amino acid transport system substrate-binding protein
VQLASVASIVASSSYDVPITTTRPSYDPTILKTAARPALESKVTVFQSYVGLAEQTPETQRLTQTYEKRYPNEPLTGRIIWTYAAATTYAEALKRACADKDLTRAGVLRAATKVDASPAAGLTVKLDFSKPGSSPGNEDYLFKLDSSVPGGMKRLQNEAYVGKNAREYTRG